MNYECSVYNEETGQQESWVSHLYILSRTGPFTEFTACGRGSHMHAIVGPHGNGGFLCLPEWQVGSGIVPLDDAFWNQARLSPLVGPVDAATLAHALKQIDGLDAKTKTSKK